MSRFSFGFGRQTKKNNKRHEHDEFFLNRGQSQHSNYRQESPYDDDYVDQDDSYDDGDENTVYDPRDPRFVMRPYRTDEANSARNTRKGADQLFPNRHSSHDYHDDDRARSSQNYRMSNDQREHLNYDAQEESSMGFRRTQGTQGGRDELGNRDELMFSAQPSGRYHQGHSNQSSKSNYQRPSSQDEVKRLGFWRDNSEEESYQEDADSDRPSPFKFVIAITGLVFVCAITWIAYRWISAPTVDSPPLIQAETDPYRVRPENPGGAAFPHQDKLIYERLAPSSSMDQNQPVERLLPAPEQPVIMQPTYQQDPNAQPMMQGQQPPVYQQQSNNGSNPTQPYGGGMVGGGVATQPPLPQQGYASVDVNGMSLQGQSVGSGYYQQPQMAHPQPSVQPIQSQPYAQQGLPQQGVQQPAYASHSTQPMPVDGNNRPMAQNPATLMHAEAGAMPIQGAASQQPQIVSVQSQQVPLPPAAVQQGAEEIADGVPHYLQLGTLPNKALADKEKARLQKRYAGELVGMDLSVRAFVGADKKTKYRIVAGPMLRSRKAAIDKCVKMGGACQPIKG